MDTGCVELQLGDDGILIFINCTAVGNEIAGYSL